MSGRQFVINSRKYDGQIARSWTGTLIEAAGSYMSLAGEFDSDVAHDDLGLIRKGTVSYEHFWTDRWYSIFRFEFPRGTLRNHYCNINMPPLISDGVIDYIDLDVDVVVWPDGRREVLDLADLERNATLYRYPAEIVDRAMGALDEIHKIIDAGSLP